MLENIFWSVHPPVPIISNWYYFSLPAWRADRSWVSKTLGRVWEICPCSGWRTLSTGGTFGQHPASAFSALLRVLHYNILFLLFLIGRLQSAGLPSGGYADWDFLLSYESNRVLLRRFGLWGGSAWGAPEVGIRTALGMLSSRQPPASRRSAKTFSTKGIFFANVYLWMARAVISLAYLFWRSLFSIRNIPSCFFLCLQHVYPHCLELLRLSQTIRS